MDPNLTPEPSLLSDYSAISPSYKGQDDPGSLSQAESRLDNIQSNDSDEGLNIRATPLYEPQYPSVLHLVRGISNDQLQLCESLSLPLEGLPLIRDHDSDLPVPAHPNDADNIHATFTKVEPADRENCIPLSSGVSVLPAPLESSFGMVTEICSSPESYTESRLQGDYADVMSFSRGHLICELVEISGPEENPRPLHSS